MKSYITRFFGLFLSYSALCSPVHAYLDNSGSYEIANQPAAHHKLFDNGIFGDGILRDHYELIGAYGIAKGNWGDLQLGVTSNETDTLKQTNQSTWNAPVGQIGAGYVYYREHARAYSRYVQWLPSIEPEVNFYASSNRINGTVYRFNNPGYNDLNYGSTINTMRLMLDAALTIVSKSKYSLFAIGGIGGARSTISYSDNGNGNDGCGLPSLTLNNNNHKSFVWELGTGVAYAFTDRGNLSLEYLYTNYGNLKLPTSINNGSLTAPQISSTYARFYTQSVLLGLHIGLA